jgi:hypothetical protein
VARPAGTTFCMFPNGKTGIRRPNLSTLPTSGPGILVTNLPGGRTIVTANPKPQFRNRRNGPLVLTLDRPRGYTETDSDTKGWVTWGHVNSVVVDNVARSYTLAAGLKVYVKVTTNGAIPLRVLTAEIDATTGTRTDSGGTTSTPPTTAYYLLGQVGGAGTVQSPYFLSNAGSGNLAARVTATGYDCTLATAGNPGATPPVPASPGGITTSYQFAWNRGN